MGAYLHHHSWSSAASWKYVSATVESLWDPWWCGKELGIQPLLFFPAIPPNTSKGFTAMQKRIKPPLGKININVDAAIGELQACCAAVMAKDLGLDKDAIAEDKDATGLECEMVLEDTKELKLEV
uniref:Uncharacterized protein n=1 Tax=Fagus sylvatica TaxID=28930 RepID=A0A2N9HTT6_FAGSY